MGFGFDDEEGVGIGEAGGAEFLDGAVGESGAEGGCGAFELETGLAIRATEIEDGRVAGKRVERIGRAPWAIEFACGPGFAGNAGSLRRAFVVLQTFGGQGEVHVRN